MRLIERAKSRLGIGRLGESTILFSSGLGIRALLQVAYLILLSRWMGPDGYGYFSGSVAAAMILSPLAGWGVSFLVASRVGRDKSTLGALWATAILQIAASGVLLIGGLMLVSGWLLEHRLSTIAMLALALAELVAQPLANAAAGASLAAERAWATTITTCVVPLGRLAMLVVLVATGTSTDPDQVAGMHLAGTVLGAIAAYAVMHRIGVRPLWRDRIPAMAATREGFSHAIGAMVGASYLEFDKVILLQTVDAAAAGAYTVAFRAVALFILPISALMAATVPRMCAAAGTAAEPRLRRAVLWSVLGYSLLAVLAAAAASPLLPLVFGAGFGDASHYMLLLAPWLPAYAAHQYFGMRLTTSGHQAPRVGVESAGCVLLLALNLSWIPAMGPAGAVAALLVAEGLMVAGLAWMVVRRCR